MFVIFKICILAMNIVVRWSGSEHVLIGSR